MDRLYISFRAYASESYGLRQEFTLFLGALTDHHDLTLLGMAHEEPADDPQLGNKRHQLVTSAARKLEAAGMVMFNESTKSLVITDLGRIAAKYYIRTQSIEIFNKEFRPIMSEADVLGLLSMSTEVSGNTRCNCKYVYPDDSLIKFNFEKMKSRSLSV